MDYKVFQMFSDIMEDTYEISVSLPKNYDEKNKYPVVYLTDANIFFGIVSGTAHLLQFGKEIPDCIIVGIGYLKDHLYVRNRDLCPTKYDMPEIAGRANDFLRYIKDELMLKINDDYAVDENNLTLAGDSLGGLFGAYVLFHEPALFNNYIVGSPSLYYDDRITFNYEEKYNQSYGELKAKVFISAGALEAVYEPEFARMVDNAVELAEVLKKRNYKGLNMMCHVFEDETHLSVIPATFSRGLRYIFNGKGIEND